MSRAMRTRFVPAIGIALLITLQAGSLRADSPDFRLGVRAYRLGQYDEAARRMQLAIDKQRGESSDLITISGGDRLPYTPYAYLGASLARLGRCDEARRALAVSEQAGIISRNASVLQLVRSTCPPPPIPAPVPQPQPALTPTPTPVAPIPTPPAPTPPPLQPVTETIATATTTTQPVTATSGSATPLPVQPPDATALRTAIATARQLIASSTNAATPQLRVARTALSASIDKSSAAVKSQSQTDINTALRSLTAAVGQYRGVIVASGPSPGNLPDAIRAYSRGDYAKTVALLTSNNVTDPVYRGQTALFRGAARYAQYAMGNGRDQNLKKLIDDDVKEFREFDRRHPDVSARIFTPPYRALVAGVPAR